MKSRKQKPRDEKERGPSSKLERVKIAPKSAANA